MARDVALSHHERVDGLGYPNGLAGNAIPLCARSVALADVYDALTSRRGYKDSFTHAVARNIILDGIGMHFDPDVVEAFIESEPQIRGVREQFNDGTPSEERAACANRHPSSEMSWSL